MFSWILATTLRIVVASIIVAIVVAGCVFMFNSRVRAFIRGWWGDVFHGDRDTINVEECTVAEEPRKRRTAGML